VGYLKEQSNCHSRESGNPFFYKLFLDSSSEAGMTKPNIFFSHFANFFAHFAFKFFVHYSFHSVETVGYVLKNIFNHSVVTNVSPGFQLSLE